jgi:hypothetical protein
MTWHRAGIAVVFAAATSMMLATSSHAQAPPSKALNGTKKVACSFPLMATGTWESSGAPKAEVTRATLTVSYDSIDTEDGTARVNTTFGAVPIIAKVSIWSLHFLQMGPDGSLRLTTIFDTETRPGRFKAVHTIHEYTQVSLPGFTSRPEQYYGECAVER